MVDLFAQTKTLPPHVITTYVMANHATVRRKARATLTIASRSPSPSPNPRDEWADKSLDANRMVLTTPTW